MKASITLYAVLNNYLREIPINCMDCLEIILPPFSSFDLKCDSLIGVVSELLGYAIGRR